MKPRKVRPPTWTLEQSMDRELELLQRQLVEEFDLSVETAKANGASRAHQPFSRNGDSKTGGDMLTGSLAVQRYISYRGANHRAALCGELAQGDVISQAYWRVMGSSDLWPLIGVTPQKSCIREDGSTSDQSKYTSFADAAAVYRQLLGRFAPVKRLPQAVTVIEGATITKGALTPLNPLNPL